MDPNLPTGSNINWALIIGAIAMILAYFHIVIPADIQAAAVTVIGGITAIVVFVLHNFVNHPANVEAAKKFAKEQTDRAVSAARKNPNAIAFFLVGGLLLLGTPMLSGCSMLSGIVGSSTLQTAETDLYKGGTAFSTLQATYVETCVNGSQSFCASIKADAKSASHGGRVAYDGAAALVLAGNGDPAAIETLVQTLVNDASSLQTKSVAARHADVLMTIVTIAQIAIQLEPQIAQAINAIDSSTPVTPAQITGLQRAIDGQDDAIQAN